MANDSARVSLLSSHNSTDNDYARRSRRGIFVIFALFLLTLTTITLYLFSSGYNAWQVNQRILKLQSLVPGGPQSPFEQLSSHLYQDQFSSQTNLNYNKIKFVANNEPDNQFVHPELWGTKSDPDDLSPGDGLKHSSSKTSGINLITSARVANYFDKKQSLAKFDMSGSDVMVFLHIQNTGGNIFGRHLVEDLVLDRPCNCRKRRCQCWRPQADNRYWLFSRWTVGWRCGVHADWTELTYCVDRTLDELEARALKRRYFYITLLRDPVTRFLSEYQRARVLGGSANNGRHSCRGKEVDSMPVCNFSATFSLEEYLACNSNLALNRQTRMLADLGLVNCYNLTTPSKQDRDLIMLTSAKGNLHKMAFFGLTEFPRISQKLFEQTFDLMFLDADHSLTRGKRSLTSDLSQETIDAIKAANHLDMKLYAYAKELLFRRFDTLEGKYSEPKTREALIQSDQEAIDWGKKEDETITLGTASRRNKFGNQ